MKRMTQVRSVLCLSLALIMACTPFFSADAIERAPQSDTVDTVQEQPAESDELATEEDEEVEVPEPEEKQQSADTSFEPSAEEYRCMIRPMISPSILTSAPLLWPLPCMSVVISVYSVSSSEIFPESEVI